MAKKKRSFQVEKGLLGLWYRKSTPARGNSIWSEHKGSWATKKGRPRAGRSSDHAKKCKLFLLATEWEVTLPGLCVRKTSLTALWIGEGKTRVKETSYNHCKIQGRDCEDSREKERENRLGRMGRLWGGGIKQKALKIYEHVVSK